MQSDVKQKNASIGAALAEFCCTCLYREALLQGQRAVPGESIIEAQSNLWLSTVLRSIGDAVIACDGEGRVVFMNGVAETLTGWTEEQAKGLPLSDIFHIVNESTREQVENPVDKVRRLGSIVGLANHTLLLRRDHSEISIDDSGAPIFAEDGSLSGIVMIFRDITERRRAERNLELLSASGAALASTLDVTTTLKSVAQLCIQSFCDFCYFDLIGPDGALQRTAWQHRDPAKLEVLERATRFRPAPGNTSHPVTRAASEGRPLLVPRVTEDYMAAIALNDEHHAAMRELNVHSLISIPLQSGSEQLGVLTFCRTIHPNPFDTADVNVGEELGRRVSAAIMNGRLYRTLATREDSLRLALQAGKIGIWELHPPTGTLLWSPRCSEIFGVPHEEAMTLRKFFNVLHPDDRAKTEEAVKKAFDPDGSGDYDIEYRAVHSTGETRWVHAMGRAFFERSKLGDSKSEMVATRFVGMVLDVTEARQAEASIRASEARFRTLIDNASVGILIGDMEGAISYANPALLKLLGYTRDDVREGKVRWDKLTPAEFAERDQRAVQQLSATGTCEPYEKAFLNAEGKPVPLLLGATMIGAGIRAEKNRAGNEVAVFLTDLTGLRQTETALRESEKLAAVGRLAGSIAHEINNPLEAVTNLLYLVGNQVTELPLKQLVATAQEELARVSHIVTHTLRFHRQATRPTSTLAASVLESVLALYRGRIVNADVKVETRYRAAKPLLCYEGEIRQVLANLVGNALDASSRGGRLMLREREGTDWKSSRKGVWITIADTGSGMNEETRRKAFKAFFTTKGIGGTGLGLWISEEIVQRHGGYMKVRSRSAKEKMGSRGSGTVFMMFLPYEIA
jgi:PAS domain S-box-containing protein